MRLRQRFLRRLPRRGNAEGFFSEASFFEELRRSPDAGVDVYTREGEAVLSLPVPGRSSGR